ncbi:electron transport complex subunit E [Sulfurirhabdus autotrophica]|uniref:Ion-translocating oxidoreductase complex subunit E n=1 Tax=Sulfurirhabdus autotrophica TaxID=1706046 RepID=A0A4R3YGX1_9PROT|nr:electron transport complex subunit E [Sulfurirhabdus autotrophica]TCV90498.1 electron transport complex protein RnfE [Sulfurirhabdus autotrophica]
MSNQPSYKEIIRNGLWNQNTGLVQLLGLCPLLAVSTTAVNGISLGLATAIVMSMSNGAVSAVRNVVPNEIRIPVFILIIAVLVTVVQMGMNAFVHPLYLVLGIFIPLIVTNCIVLARTEAFASKNRVLPSMVDGLMMGVGLTLVLAVLGGAREIIGKGTLFSGLDMVFGEAAKHMVLHVIPDYHGFLLAILPPGAFIGLGLLIAGKNYLEQRATAKPETHQPDIQVATA